MIVFHPWSHSRSVIPPVVTLLVLAVRPASGIDRAFVEDLPAGTIAALLVEGHRDAKAGRDAMTFGASTLGELSRMGVFSELATGQRLVLDCVSALPALTGQPIALVLTDVRAVCHDSAGHQLAGLQVGLIARTAGQDDSIQATIQQFINGYTNTETCRMDPLERSWGSIHRLTCGSWPDWTVFEWGAVGRYYAVSLGSGGYERIAAGIVGKRTGTPQQDWLMQAYERLDMSDTAIAWFVDFDALRRALDTPLQSTLERTLKSLGYSTAQRGAWCIAPEGRAIRFERLLQDAGRDVGVRLGRAGTADEFASGIIPPHAERYSILQWQASATVLGLRNAYWGTRSPVNRDRLISGWQSMEDSLGLSIDRDLLGQLGPRAIIHTDPPHPLGIDVLCTVQFEIAGSSNSVRRTIDALLRKWQSSSRSAGLTPWVHRDPDGVWYLKFGLMGPALTVLDRWVVVSFSPQAVRQNVARIAAAERAEKGEGILP